MSSRGHEVVVVIQLSGLLRRFASRNDLLDRLVLVLMSQLSEKGKKYWVQDYYPVTHIFLSLAWCLTYVNGFAGNMTIKKAR